MELSQRTAHIRSDIDTSPFGHAFKKDVCPVLCLRCMAVSKYNEIDQQTRMFVWFGFATHFEYVPLHLVRSVLRLVLSGREKFDSLRENNG